MRLSVVPALTFAVILGTSAATILSAAPAAAGEIAQRQVAMKSIGGAMKILTGTFKGEMAFDGKEIAAAGYTVANNLAAARTLFPEGSEGDSRAKPEIWQDMAGFLAALEKADGAAKQVAAAGEAGDEAAFKTAFAGLGEGCKGCHEKYRKPKE